MRASQINGCAYCIDMHSKDARSEGETEQRLYALTSWRETPFFTARERAALAWTEALTLITLQRACVRTGDLDFNGRYLCTVRDFDPSLGD
jgi:AhpD family alkylhydroperoxidase